MLYIRKQTATAEITQEINRVKRDVDWSHADHPDSEFARNVFDMLDKSIIRTRLLQEQKEICAYCMRRIRNNSSTTIEHWMPISVDSSQALDYSNMMASCDGGKTNDNMPHILSCDASKGNQALTINPYNELQMSKIRYHRDGRIYTDPEDNELDYDINYVLHLNGEVDHDGNTVYDTATELVYGRSQVYREFEDFIRGLNRKGKPLRPAIKRKLEEIRSSSKSLEFAGVWIYLLSRKLKQVH